MAFVMLSGYTCVANQEKEAVRHGTDKGSLLPDPGIPACQGDGGARRGTIVWNYIGELVFNMLVLVGAIKMSDRLVRELMGLG